MDVWVISYNPVQDRYSVVQRFLTVNALGMSGYEDDAHRFCPIARRDTYATQSAALQVLRACIEAQITAIDVQIASLA